MTSLELLSGPVSAAALLALATGLGVGRQSTAKPQSSLAPAVQPFVDSHSLAGAVMLVANKSKILELSAVGYADVAAKKPMQSDDLFWIASESKPITATALMMLVDEGKVHLDDPVSKFIPEFGNLWVKAEQEDDRIVLKKVPHQITVREILSHTSGLGFASPIERPTLDLLPLRVSTLSYAAMPLEYEPGSKYQYSNEGINTAGRIIEVVSGIPYEKFLSDRLLKPLGMRDTTFRPNKRQLALLAKSYRPNKEKTDLVEMPISQLKYPLDDPSRYPVPAGGLFSTARDMASFGQLILSGGVFNGKRLVSESAISEMTRRQTGAALTESYGLGWSTGGDGFGHGGAYSTNFWIDAKNGLVLIWMVQHAGFPNNGSESYGAFSKAALNHYGLPANP